MPDRIAEHAVVIGAGMGGLAAAAALAPHFGRVTVLDRDGLPEEPSARPGTPQCRHTHALLAGGLKALEALTPGFGRNLEKAGAVRARVGSDVFVERPGYDPFPRRDLGFDVFCMSRPLLELSFRRRVESEPNVTVRARSRAVEIVASADRASAAGVRCEGADQAAETIAADLVVDASGRAAPTLAFLDSAGFARPGEDEIGIDQAYSTAVYEGPQDAAVDWLGFIHLPDAPRTSRTGFILPLENGRFIVSLGGNHGDSPPGETEGFMAFAKSLRTPTITNAIRNAKQIGEIVRFNLPASVRRRFERLDRFPRGLIPIADSVCRFNPIFGQGMSVAAQEAAALGRLTSARAGLADPLDGLAPAFFAEIQPLLESPWGTSVSDFIYPRTRGDKPPDFEKRMQFGAGLTHLSALDPDVHQLIAEVAHLLKPQSALRDPEIAKRVTELMAARA